MNVQQNVGRTLDQELKPLPGSLLARELLPSMLRFGALILATIVIDALLHWAGLAAVGRWLGIPGVLLIVGSFAYSLRKRRLISYGRPASLLRLHEAMAWAGSLMILVHAGVHVHALLPWLAVAALLINVASGVTGAHLLARARTHVRTRRAAYLAEGLDEEAVTRSLFWDATALDLMKNWRTVHIPLAFLLVGLTVAHVLAALFFWTQA